MWINDIFTTFRVNKKDGRMRWSIGQAWSTEEFSTYIPYNDRACGELSWLIKKKIASSGAYWTKQSNRAYPYGTMSLRFVPSISYLMFLGKRFYAPRFGWGCWHLTAWPALIFTVRGSTIPGNLRFGNWRRMKDAYRPFTYDTFYLLPLISPELNAMGGWYSSCRACERIRLIIAPLHETYLRWDQVLLVNSLVPSHKYVPPRMCQGLIYAHPKMNFTIDCYRTDKRARRASRCTIEEHAPWLMFGRPVLYNLTSSHSEVCITLSWPNEGGLEGRKQRLNEKDL